MAIKHYIITIDESAMTDALRAQLEALGAEVQEVPIEELDLPEDKALEMINTSTSSSRGETSKAGSLKQEVRAYP